MDYIIIRYSNLTAESLNITPQSLSLKSFDDNYISHIKEQIKCFLADLPYPNIDAWFNKVINEINNHPENREIFICLSNDGESPSILGLVILKKTHCEKKICTLKVDERYQRKGIGSALILKAFDFLETDKPLITVPEEYENMFSKILNKFGFKKTDEIHGLYRADKIEYIYNGLLNDANIKKE